ncbi:helix-turn-helix transcriptional regulator [Marinifilum fragile]|uniref:helix-turn-helix domain-containing protein n=1 Tax=Marinifilum fragile TaxID=570161 RepID=UPI002AA5F439|nr:helix-turn-helix transcriptional regulator [Marinifilum fragile]
MSKTLDRINKIASKEPSKWLEKAKERRANKDWMDLSAKIAIRILREIRAQKKINGMSQKRLAEEMGVSPQYINKVVKGQEKLNIETICKIGNVLGVVLLEVPTLSSSQAYTSTVVVHGKVERSNAKPIAKKQINYTLLSRNTPNYTDYKSNGTNG